MAYANAIYRLRSIIIDSSGVNELNAINNTPLAIYPDMFEESANSGASWTVLTTFVYWTHDSAPVNCTLNYSSNSTIYVTPTYVTFSFKPNSGSASVPGYAYPNSIGGTNISISLIKSVLGETVNNIKGLCTSSKINPFSPNKPNGTAPYTFGSFRFYSHDVKGGVNLLGSVSNAINYLDYYTYVASATKNCEPLGNVKLDAYINGSLYASVQKDLSTSSYIYYESASLQNTNYITVTKTVRFDVSKWNGSAWILMATESGTTTFYGSPLNATLTSLVINSKTTSLNWGLSIYSATGGNNLTFIITNNTRGHSANAGVTTVSGTNGYSGISNLQSTNYVGDSFTISCSTIGFSISGTLNYGLD